MAGFTRGFRGQDRGERDPRLPPGQYDAGAEWPVLNAEVTPTLATESWTFRIDGLVEQPTTWTWEEIHALTPATYDGAIHCVTTWSKLDIPWEGVQLSTVIALAQPKPEATHVMTHAYDGYTTNLALEVV